MKVSVVILNWNGRDMLERFLPSVCRHSAAEGVETVVADNCSTDDSVSFVRSNFPQVRVIELDRNYGFAEGYNRALSMVDSEYFVLLNSDVEVTASWLDPIVEYMDSHADVAACQPKVLSYYDKSRFEHAGASGGFIDSYGYPFCRGRIFDSVEEDCGQYDSVCRVFWGTGAALFIRSEAYRACGGLDAGFFAHMEEIDLCWRLNSRGYRVMCIPQSVIYHVGGGTLNVGNPRKTFLNFRNNLLMIYKNAPDEKLRKILFVRFFLDYLSAVSFLVRGDFANCRAVFRARREYSSMKGLYISSRRENMSLSVEVPSAGVYGGSIVYAYFIKRLKTFCKIMK